MSTIVTKRKLMFDPLSTEFKDDPYPTLRYLRETDPVHRSMYGMWIVTRYDDVMFVMKDKRFKRDFESGIKDMYGEAGLENYATGIMRHWIVNTNSSEHSALKLHIKAALNASVKSVATKLDSIARNLVQQGLDRGSFDLVADLTFPMTAIVICEMLGVPMNERDMFVGNSIFPRPGLLDVMPLSPSENAVLTAQTSKVMEYFYDLCDRKRDDGKEDFTSELLRRSEQYDDLKIDVITAHMFFMFFAGHQSTQNLMSNVLYALYANPEQLQVLKQRPDIINLAIEELIRFDTSVQTGHAHYAQDDVQIGGTLIRKGEVVLPLLGAANRDPELSEDPEELNILRSRPRHLSFGAGDHFCMGARLAATEVKAAVVALLDKMPDLKLSKPNEIERIPTYTLRGIRALPVEW